METVDRIRSATFTVTRRGYDRREVDNYLTKLADWLDGGGAEKVHAGSIRDELERIGAKTTKVLTAAAEAAEQIRGEAEIEARQIAADARSHVESARTSADQYAKRVRAEADAEASKQLEEARAKAIKMVEEGTKRRREIEKVISDLQTRREAVVKGLEQLSSQLAGAATQSRSIDAQPASPAPTTQ